jgi:Arc/MetJ-type ribon-helix-helix transcriptional regulator
MPTYRVNEAGVRHVRELVDAGEFDDTTEWSRAAPSAQQENEEIERAADELLERLDGKRGRG